MLPTSPSRKRVDPLTRYTTTSNQLSFLTVTVFRRSASGVLPRGGPRVEHAPTLLQAAAWAGLAAALGYALTRRRLETRLWIWSLSFAAIFAAYRIVPIVVWDYPADVWPLVWSVALPAAVILLPLVLTTGEAPEEGEDGDLQEGE